MAKTNNMRNSHSFKMRDKFFCTQGKYKSHTLIILNVGNQKFTVKFDDNNCIEKIIAFVNVILIITTKKPVSKTNYRFYVVACRREPYIYNSWDKCNAQVTGYSNAKHNKFTTWKDVGSFTSMELRRVIRIENLSTDQCTPK